MTLTRYQTKRNFKKTPEPPASHKATQGKHLRFVVQKHHARQLHYDFRLEHGGVLKSWAVPKGIPRNAGEKRLAVAVEDHPLEYATFAGIIPKGEYGAGTVEIWDKGFYRLVGSMRGDSFKIILAGKKLKGSYTLVRLNGKKPRRPSGSVSRPERRDWLLIKEKI